MARNTGAMFGDIGEIILVRPLMHKRIGDQNNPAIVQKRGHASGTMRGIGVKYMVHKL